MFSVASAISLLLHFSDPYARRLSDADLIVLSISGASAIVFIVVGLLLYRGRVGVGTIRIIEPFLWADLVILAISAVGLLAVGSISVSVWLGGWHWNGTGQGGANVLATSSESTGEIVE
ncbi:hypothetical protein ACFXK0_22045 [Nocardia sp. NPDC059177]|uniref:hypothetical protein n=1 Tax=Nocardia sp. NPDC059177 TaxID=3346759 RepID=UPI00367B70FF